jgi:hypothetical protein
MAEKPISHPMLAQTMIGSTAATGPWSEPACRSAQVLVQCSSRGVDYTITLPAWIFKLRQPILIILKLALPARLKLGYSAFGQNWIWRNSAKTGSLAANPASTEANLLCARNY